jgi:hypothetical protein
MSPFAYYDPNLNWEDVLRTLVSLLFLLLILAPAWLGVAFLIYLVRQKRFQLKDLFWLTLVVACLLGWWRDRSTLYWQQDWYKRSANLSNRRSDEVIEAVRKAGYEIQFDDNEDRQGMRFLKTDSLADESK